MGDASVARFCLETQNYSARSTTTLSETIAHPNYHSRPNPATTNFQLTFFAPLSY